MIRILIADDYAVVRQGLKKIVEESGEMQVVAEAANGADALSKIRQITCDVVLLDISMHGMSGIDVLKQVRVTNPELPVLILSNYPEDQYALRLIKAGAAGYLTKESAPALIMEAVRRVVDGKSYISRAVARMLADELCAATLPLREGLAANKKR
jgi:DNA-binding NarL/FixJ family response regulator